VSASVDPWTRANLDRLAELESRAPVAAAGDTLLHGDLRADNVLITTDGAMVVDWPGVTTGAGWIDFLFAVPSISMHGGGAPERLWAGYPPARDADPDAVNAVLAAAMGYYVVEGAQPAPRNNPRMRFFQQAIGAAGVAWLRRRLG
jgi:Ser/Thr protein kinase RdoA (MazF antagonist)